MHQASSARVKAGVYIPKLHGYNAAISAKKKVPEGVPLVVQGSPAIICRDADSRCR